MINMARLQIVITGVVTFVFVSKKRVRNYDNILIHIHRIKYFDRG